MSAITGKAFRFLLPALLVACAGVMTLKDYEPSSPDESTIKEILLEFQDAWNQQAKEDLLALLDDDFILWQGNEKERKILLTKARYGFYIRDLWRNIRFINLGKPSFWFDGAKASVFMAMSIDGKNIRTIFRLIKRNDRWWLLDWEI
jgi:hypothetical protein